MRSRDGTGPRCDRVTIVRHATARNAFGLPRRAPSPRTARLAVGNRQQPASTPTGNSCAQIERKTKLAACPRNIPPAHEHKAASGRSPAQPDSVIFSRFPHEDRVDSPNRLLSASLASNSRATNPAQKPPEIMAQPLTRPVHRRSSMRVILRQQTTIPDPPIFIPFPGLNSR